MSYTAMAHGFTQHPKVMGLHDRAFRFHVTALDYCSMNLTDGHVSARGVRVVAAIVDTQPKRWTAELVTAGLWHHDVEGDGFWIHDYLKHNPSAESMKALRDVRRAAGLAGAEARWGHTKSGGKTDAKSGGKTHGKRHMPEEKREEEKEKTKGLSVAEPAAGPPEPPGRPIGLVIEESLKGAA